MTHCASFLKWSICSIFFTFSFTTQAEDSTTVHIVADQVKSIGNHTISAFGNVSVEQGNFRANAQHVRYNDHTSTIWADETVIVEKSGDVLIGKLLNFTNNTATGQLEETSYFLRDQAARGDAAKLLFTGKEQYHLKKGRFTTCDLGDDSWYIQGDDIALDFTNNSAIAHHASLEFKGIPLLYTPWLNFPLNGARQSGFLVPIFGSNSNTGINIGLPYYWNIAPNYDATLIPQWYSKRGLMLGAEFRYLQPTYQGILKGEFLPNDHLAHRNRHSWQVLHQQNLTPNLYFQANLQGVSDDRYFTNLASNIQASSTTHLPRNLALNYQGDNTWYATLRTEQYQILQPATHDIVKPYTRLPQFTFGGTPFTNSVFTVNLTGDFNHFKHPVLTNGSRLIMYPTVSLPIETPFAFIRPKLGLHSTVYKLDTDQNTRHSKHTRILPIASVDAGLIFERDLAISQQKITQTLEPRLYYVYIPYKNQSTLPNFDSSEIDFNFSQMFYEHQFTGGDRINNANQLTTALTSRFYHTETGLEKLRFNIGQRFYFTEQLVTLSAPARPITHTRSDIIVSASAELFEGVAMGSSWQYNRKDNQTNKMQIEFAWNPAPAKVANIRYHFFYDKMNPIRQLDLAGQWPIGQRWYAVGRYNFSFETKKALDMIAGLQYNAGCWGLQFVMQRYVTDSQFMNTSFYIMLNLRGLGGIGNNPISLLRDRIPGYSKIN